MTTEIISLVIESVYKAVMIAFVIVTTINWKIYDKKIRELEQKIKDLRVEVESDRHSIWKITIGEIIRKHENILKYLVEEKEN